MMTLAPVADPVMVMHRADLVAVMMARMGLRHAGAEGDNERQGGDRSFH
jgi:hypothetical protein